MPLPLARRSADDLSGLMVLSAQTWVEQPADRRPDFEDELRTRHLLALRPGMPPPADTGLRHGFYLRFLERALERRLGGPAFFHAEAGATVTVCCPKGLRVQAAPGLSGRVVDNLLGNAIRYAPGPVELQARLDAGTPADTVRISVLDRGPGIPPDQLAAMWRPFQRIEGSRSPQTGGYGLGLAIVRQLAQSQGWQPELAAREGGGLQASVGVPLATS